MKIAPDKIGHLIVGAVLTLLYFIWEPLIATGVLWGFCKEIYDLCSETGTFDPMDIVWTLMGCEISILSIIVWG